MNFELYFVIYFIYGMAFFSMGLILLLETWRLPPEAPQQKLLKPLAVFGIIHGVHEWLEIFIIQSTRIAGDLSIEWEWVRFTLLAVSFLALGSYSFHTFLYSRIHITPLHIFGVTSLVLFVLFTSWDMIGSFLVAKISFEMLIEGLIRHVLGVSGAAIATIALHTAVLKAKADNRRPLDFYLSISSSGFALYSLTQIFIPSMDTLIARWLSVEVFLTITQIPIQLIRTIAAIIITIGLFLTTRFLEGERQLVVAAAQRVRLEVLEKQESMRRDLLRQTVKVLEDERKRIAREIHDEMAQSLTAFSLDLATLQKMVEKQNKLAPILNRLQDLVRKMSFGMTRLVNDLRPAILDDLGLVAALNSLVENDTVRLGLQVSFTVSGQKRRLNPLIETVIYRIAQEALTNIARHAQTNEACLGLEFGKDIIELNVSDPGIGFDQNAIPPGSWGLVGMQERAGISGGQLQVVTKPGCGTVINVRIPTT